MTNPYVPLLFFLAIGGGFAIFSVAIAPLTGPKRYNRAKMDAYECGIQPSPQAEGGGRVPIKYFLTAMLFIIFDVESVFLYPFAVAFGGLGLFALVEMVLFILTVFVAYACGLENADEIGRGLNLSGLARRLNIADGTTVKLHLQRYFERFRKRPPDEG